MNEAVAYLVLARGTGPENRLTSWSTTAVGKCAGMGIVPAKEAIKRLLQERFLRFAAGHTNQRPRYELILPETTEDAEEDDNERIWLPNSIVTGTETGGEIAPVQRLRAAGDVWALRLFVDLYNAQNLRDDGGISPQVLRQEFRRERIAEQGIYVVWAFTAGSYTASWTGPLALHQKRKRNSGEKDHPVWDSVGRLRKMGLLTYVPHLFENDSQESEIMHPYGIGGHGEIPIETQIGETADAAARNLADWIEARAEEKGCDHLCPVMHTLPNVQMIGVARLHYRPRTRRTAAWYAQAQTNGAKWLEHYGRLGGKPEISSDDVFGIFNVG